jgi:hypothetical protein
MLGFVPHAGTSPRPSPGPTVEALGDGGRRLRQGAATLHPDRTCLGLRSIGLADGLCHRFTRLRRVSTLRAALRGRNRPVTLIDDRFGESAAVSGPFGGHDTTMIENTSLSG